MALAGTPRSTVFNNKSPTIKRILQESRELSLHPDPTLTAAPLETNLFEWHFTISGPPSTPYMQGIYHGRIILPPSYPLRPPSFRFLTPSGRFEVNREICLSISGHHEETWQPAWGIRTALCAIRAFMASEAKDQVGGLNMDSLAREILAQESRSWTCGGCGGQRNEDLIKECEEGWRAAHRGEDHEEVVVPEDLRLAFKEDIDNSRKSSASSLDFHKENTSPKLALHGLQPSSAPQSLVTRDNRRTESIPGRDSPESLTTSNLQIPPIKTSSASFESAASSSSDVSVVPEASTTSRPQGRSRAQENVPAWVDKAILGVVLTLIFMFIKKLVGWSGYL